MANKICHATVLLNFHTGNFCRWWATSTRYCQSAITKHSHKWTVSKLWNSQTTNTSDLVFRRRLLTRSTQLASVEDAISQNQWGNEGPSIESQANPAGGNLHPHCRLIGIKHLEVRAWSATQETKIQSWKSTMCTRNDNKLILLSL